MAETTVSPSIAELEQQLAALDRAEQEARKTYESSQRRITEATALATADAGTDTAALERIGADAIAILDRVPERRAALRTQLYTRRREELRAIIQTAIKFSTAADADAAKALALFREGVIAWESADANANQAERASERAQKLETDIVARLGDAATRLEVKLRPIRHPLLNEYRYAVRDIRGVVSSIPATSGAEQ